MANNFHPLFDDKCFNHVFSKEEYALDFINSLFNTKYKHEDVLLKSEDVLSETEYNDKKLRCDLVAEFSDVILNLEAYSVLGKHEANKSKSYAFRIYGTQIKRGREYLPKKVIQVNICGKMAGNIGFSKYGLLDIDRKIFGILDDDFIIYFVNLDKIKKEDYNVAVSDKAKKYFRLFNAKSIRKMKKISKGDDILMSITECLKEFLNNEETKKDFDREEWQQRKYQAIGEERGIKIGEERGIKIGEERGIKIGKECGREDSLNYVATNMLQANKPIDEITAFTGLTEDAVLELKKTIK